MLFTQDDDEEEEERQNCAPTAQLAWHMAGLNKVHREQPADTPGQMEPNDSQSSNSCSSAAVVPTILLACVSGSLERKSRCIINKLSVIMFLLSRSKHFIYRYAYRPYNSTFSTTKPKHTRILPTSLSSCLPACSGHTFEIIINCFLIYPLDGEGQSYICHV